MNVAVRNAGDAARQAVEAAAATLVSDAVEADLVVADGDAGVASLVSEPVSVPVLPVGGGKRHHFLARELLPDAIERFREGRVRTAMHPILGTVIDGEQVGQAAFDLTLMSSVPAHISEFAVRVEDAPVEEVRADGLVLATPLGSEGYAADAGGPILEPGTGVSVVPVAPFRIRPNTHVLDLGREITLSVERGETPVSLHADGTEVANVEPHRPIRVVRDADVELIRPD